MKFLTVLFSVFVISSLAGAQESQITQAQLEQLQKNLMPMEFVKIPKGTFIMGNPDSGEASFRNELRHRVTLTHDFELQTTTVTQGQWILLTRDEGLEVLKSRPWFYSSPKNCPGGHQKIGPGLCPNHPVDDITWYQAALFANLMSIKNHLQPCYELADGGASYGHENIYECSGYRLPTEAEWEYAARAGSEDKYFFGNSEALLPEYVVFVANNPGGMVYMLAETADVGSLKPNPWGLYDVYGNVWQWMHDTFNANSSADIVDPVYSAGSQARVIRGGTAINDSAPLRSWARYQYPPKAYGILLGFRLARTIK